MTLKGLGESHRSGAHGHVFAVPHLVLEVYIVKCLVYMAGCFSCCSFDRFSRIGRENDSASLGGLHAHGNNGCRAYGRFVDSKVQ